MSNPGFQMFTMLIFFLALSSIAAEHVEMRIIRQSRPVAPTNSAQLITNVIAFAESASVNLTSIDRPDKWTTKWGEVLASDSFIHVVFTPPKAVRVSDRENHTWVHKEKPVSEILISLPEGRYPSIQVKTGTNFFVLTKWQPTAL
jgi:hypothetical protein